MIKNQVSELNRKNVFHVCTCSKTMAILLGNRYAGRKECLKYLKTKDSHICWQTIPTQLPLQTLLNAFAFGLVPFHFGDAIQVHMYLYSALFYSDDFVTRISS